MVCSFSLAPTTTPGLWPTGTQNPQAGFAKLIVLKRASQTAEQSTLRSPRLTENIMDYTWGHLKAVVNKYEYPDCESRGTRGEGTVFTAGEPQRTGCSPREQGAEQPPAGCAQSQNQKRRAVRRSGPGPSGCPASRGALEPRGPGRGGAGEAAKLSPPGGCGSRGPAGRGAGFKARASETRLTCALAAAANAPRHGAAVAVRPAPRRSRAAAPAPAPLLFLLFGRLRPLRAGRLPALAPAGLPAGRDPRRVRLLPGVRPRRGRAVRGQWRRQGALRAGHGVREEPQEAEG